MHAGLLISAIGVFCEQGMKPCLRTHPLVLNPSCPGAFAISMNSSLLLNPPCLSQIVREDKVPRIIKWIKPAEGWTKLNFDGSLNLRDATASVGFVLRDSHGGLHSEATPCHTTSVINSEITACWYGVSKAMEMTSSTNLWIEGDAAVIIEWILRGQGDHFLLPAILRVLTRFRAIKVSREGNRCGGFDGGKRLFWKNELEAR